MITNDRPTVTETSESTETSDPNGIIARLDHVTFWYGNRGKGGAVGSYYGTASRTPSAAASPRNPLVWHRPCAGPR